MVNPGMLINGRYEIIELIGSGGMADVYKASDTRLNRMVAVKILKQEFSNDKSFITRFKNEAQSAAGLSHPNIVSVYDVGDDEGYHYIVMELVEGITLKRFIEKKGRLEVRESVGIAIQIAQGMEAAHDNHIIHRDIKPQNIIISRDGKVKVADFGIAKMVSNDTFNQNAVGSVHYLSPEQARGGYSDERSDIYSLGVTLYEMLTGQLPFAGESNVTVALAHIQNQAKPTKELVPSIPYALDRVVQKCMQKHPENRYFTASDLIIDLKHSITNPDGDFVEIKDGSDIVSEPTKTFTDKEVSQIKNQVKASQPAKTKPAKTQNAADSKVLREELEELDTIDSKWEKAIMILSILFVIGVCGGLIYAIVHFLGIGDINDIASTPTPNPAVSVTDTPTPEPTKTLTFKMPNLYGYTFDDAVRMMASYSKGVTVLEDTSEYSNDLDEGLVLKQYPIEGVDVLMNGTVRLTLSAGGEPIAIPRVIGLTKDAATSTLTTAGFLVNPVYEVSETIESGVAIRTEPATGEMLKTGEKVVLYISSGTAVSYTEVPSLVGKTVEAAINEIEEWGLVVGTQTQDYSDIFTEGYVINQSLEPKKTVFKGDVVDITISMGPYPAGYVPTPTPEPVATPGGSGDFSYNWDGSKTDTTQEAGRQFFVVEYNTSGMFNPIPENGANWMSFVIIQDGREYNVMTDYTQSVGDGISDLISHSAFLGGLSYRLYTDYGEYSQLHEGVATITAFLEGTPLEEQVIYLNLETAR